MRKFLPSFIIFAAALLLFLAFQPAPRQEIQIHTADKTYHVLVELAETPEERSKGLMGRTQLPEGEGMLFVYPEEQPVAFWMKDTLIPLDMIFIGADKRIKHIEHNVPPCKTQECPVYRPPVFVQYILEVRGEFAKDLGVALGDRVSGW